MQFKKGMMDFFGCIEMFDINQNNYESIIAAD
jgi:hypothetical protein